MDTLTRGALAEIAGEELARRSLLDFCVRVTPGFQTPKHIQYLSGLLERAESGDPSYSRLAISCPPGHGKSTLLQHFTAAYLGHNPKRRVLAISASEKLAKRNSRDTQAIVQSDRWPWPNITLATDSVLEWSTKQGGEVRAIGMGGTVTGFRAEMILVDDLQSEAGSQETQESDEEWFRSVLSTRLEPDGIVVIIQTRWSDGDIIARLAEGESGHLWRIVNLPVFAGKDDVLGRAENEELWPERWPREKLEQKRVEVGSYAFAAQYTGDPVPAGGALFKAEWLSHRYEGGIPVRKIVEPASVFEWTSEYDAPMHKLLSIDAAAKDGRLNDFCVLTSLCSDEVDFFIWDVVREKLEFNGLCRAVWDVWQKWHHDYVVIEDTSNGTPLISELRRTTNINIIAVTPKGSKFARAAAMTPTFEAGRVKLPNKAPWLDAFIHEFMRFPSASMKDDQIDATCMGIDMLDKIVAREQYSRTIRDISPKLFER